jgi:hypothetical protein
MDLTLEEARERMVRAQKEWEKQREYGDDLRKKAEKEEKDLLESRMRLAYLEGRKEELLKLVVRKKTSKDDIIPLESEIACLRLKRDAQREIVEYYDKTIKEEMGKCRELAKAYETAENIFWHAVSMHELKKSKPPDSILRAWVASNLAGKNQSLGKFLGRSMGRGFVLPNEYEQILKELLREYRPDELRRFLKLKKKGENDGN